MLTAVTVDNGLLGYPPVTGRIAVKDDSSVAIEIWQGASSHIAIKFANAQRAAMFFENMTAIVDRLHET